MTDDLTAQYVLAIEAEATVWLIGAIERALTAHSENECEATDNILDEALAAVLSHDPYARAAEAAE